MRPTEPVAYSSEPVGYMFRSSGIYYEIGRADPFLQYFILSSRKTAGATSLHCDIRKTEWIRLDHQLSHN